MKNQTIRKTPESVKLRMIPLVRTCIPSKYAARERTADLLTIQAIFAFDGGWQEHFSDFTGS